MKPTRHIVLIGPMGSGKSTVGPLIAKELGIPFRDSDVVLDAILSEPAGKFMIRQGESAFRAHEEAVLTELLNETPSVIATGGGAWTIAAFRRLCRERALSIWLSADIELLVRRIDTSERALVRAHGARKILSRHLIEREAFYREADLIIESRQEDPKETAERILLAIKGQLDITPVQKSDV